MKINLNRVSEVNIAHRLANELTKITGLSNYLEYYQKGNGELRNARFDIVLYSQYTQEIICVIEVKKKVLKENDFIEVNEETIKHINAPLKQITKYHKILTKEGILFLYANCHYGKEEELAKKIAKYFDCE